MKNFYLIFFKFFILFNLSLYPLSAKADNTPVLQTILHNILNALYNDEIYKMQVANNEYYKSQAQNKIIIFKKAFTLAQSGNAKEKQALKEKILSTCYNRPCSKEQLEPKAFELEQFEAEFTTLDYISVALLSQDKEKYFKQAFDSIYLSMQHEINNDELSTRSLSLYLYTLLIWDLSTQGEKSAALLQSLKEGKKYFTQYKNILYSKDFTFLRGYFE